MASNKKPSIYSDRSSIGSAEELAEYGVWVKSGPQILSGDNQTSAVTDLPADDITLDDDSLSVDDAILDISDDSLADFDDMKFPDDNIEIDDADNLENVNTDLGEYSFPEGGDEESSTDGINIEDANFEDFENMQGDSAEEQEIPSDDLADDSLDDLSDEQNDISINMDDSEEEIEIDDITKNNLIAENDFDESNDINTGDITKDNIIAENDSLNIDTVDFDSFDTDSFGVKKTEDSSGEDIVIEDDLLANKDENDAIIIDDDLLTAPDNYDIPTVKSIENNVGIMQDNLETAKTGGNELSSILLQQIANELSSIRNELTELKKEFASVRSGVKPPDKTDDSEHSSFFSEEDDETISLTGDELNNILGTSGEAIVEEGIPETIDDDEDETIALTGDELDNILNSADFTEESGAEENPEADFSIESEPSIESELSDEDIVIDESLDNDIDIDITPDGTELDLQEDASADGMDSLDAGIAAETDDMDLSSLDNIDFTEDEMSSIDLDDAIAGSETIDLETDESTGDAIDLEIPADEAIDISFDESTEESVDLAMDEPAVDAIDLGIDEPSDGESDAVITDDDSDIIADEILFDSLVLDDDAFAQGNDSAAEEAAGETEDSLADIDLNIETEADSPEMETGEDSFDIDNAVDALGEIDTTALEADSIEDINTDILESQDDLSLDAINEDDITHLSDAPDNSSYLEDETGDFDLSNVVIEEPDLSADDIIDDLSEPEINEADYDIDSLDDLSIDSSEIEDISIDDIPSEEDLTALKDELESGNDVIEDIFEEEITELPQQDDDVEEISEEGIIPPPKPVVKETPVKKEAAAKQETPVKQEAPSRQETPARQEAPAAKTAAPAQGGTNSGFQIPVELKSELRNILSYMDQLLESLPEQKIEEFAKSNYFDSYKKLFKELGLV